MSSKAKHSLRGSETVRTEQGKQMRKIAFGEIAELKESLRYAEFLLEKSRAEKEQLEGELARNDDKVAQVQREVDRRDREKQVLTEQLEAAGGQAQFAQMAAGKVQELARGKLHQLQTEIA